ncbi:general transcription repressor [Malassezia caprae]|uniref:General transcription repressor n=1 Tax=Malassezia caprae TaxID=1381934 RepID=A0AAF0IUI6_9BASI|nr:general transcription repressor [Malassezia caprae]
MASVNSLATVPAAAAAAASSSARPGSIPPSHTIPAHAQPIPASPPPPGAIPLNGAVAPPGSQAIWSARLVDLLNLVRHEFDVIGNDAVHFKSQRDELEHRVAQQFNEVTLMQEHIYELEKRHFEIVSHYEEEIKRLRARLDTRGNASAAPDGPPVLPPQSRAPLAPAKDLPPPTMPEVYERTPHERSPSGAEAAWPPSKRAKTALEPPAADVSRAKRDERDMKQAEAPEDASAKAKATERSVTASQDQAASPADAPAASAAEPVPMPEMKKEGTDWVVVYNPSVQPSLDIDLVHNFSHDSVVCCVRFSPDGKYLATGCNRSAHIYEIESGAKVCVLQDEPPALQGDLYIRSVCFSPCGKFLATGAEDRQIRIWDLAEKKVKKVLTGHKQEIYSLVYSNDGKMLASGSGDKTVRLWDAETGQTLHVLYTSPGLNYGPGITTVALSPDARLVAAGALDTFVRIWDTRTGKLRCRLKGHKDSIYSVSFMPDGQSLISGSLDKTLKLWSLSNVIKLLDTMDDEISNASMCAATFTGHKDYVLSVSCSMDGRWIASGSKDRCVEFWDPKTGQTQLVLQGHKNSVIATCMSQTRQLLATGSGDFNARVWSYKEK